MRFAILFVSSMNDNICTHTHAEPFRCRTMFINYNFSSIRDIELGTHLWVFYPERFRLEHTKFSSLLFSARQLAEQTTEQ